MTVRCGATTSFAVLLGSACVALAVACGRIYGDGPAGEVGDGSADGATVQNGSGSDASGAHIDGDAAVADGAAITCSSSAPSCTGVVLAKVMGDPTSVARLGDVLYWSDHSTKTIQQIPTQNGLVGSTILTPAGGVPSRLASVGGQLAWFADTFAGTGMPARRESGQGDTLTTCSPSAGCMASSRSVAGTSAAASDGAGGILFGTVQGTTAHAIRIPSDLSSTASQDLTGSEPALVDTTYAVGTRLVWFTSEAVNSCSLADCLGTRAQVAKLAGKTSASAAGNTAVVWTTSPPLTTIMGVTVTAAGAVSPVATLLAVTDPVTAVFVDDDHVIFASAGSRGPGLYRCPLAGCNAAQPPELVARGGAGDAVFIAADAQAFYWFVIDNPGLAFTVYRAPR